MEIAMLFASLPGKGGRSLTPRAKQYCKKASEFIKENPHRCVLFVKAAIGFTPQELFSQLIQKELENLGVGKWQIIVLCGKAHSTLGEIESVEEYLKHVSRDVAVYAIGSWQHIPRILLLWKLHYGRGTKPLCVWEFSLETLFLLALEPLKFLLSLFPSRLQAWLNDILFKPLYK